MTSNRSFQGNPQGLFRWISDVAVVEAFESGVLDLPDFCFTGDDCRYHLEPERKRRFLDLLRERFNAGVKHSGRTMKWTTIERKAVELSCYLVSRTEKLDFSDYPQQGTIGDRDLSRQILTCPSHGHGGWESERALCQCLRSNATLGRPARVYNQIRRRLDMAHENETLGAKKC